MSAAPPPSSPSPDTGPDQGPDTGPDQGPGSQGAPRDAAAPAAKPTWARVVMGQVLSILLLLLAVFSIRWSLADHYEVPTGSMKPTVAINDRILVNKVAYSVRVPFTNLSLWDFDGPARGDVVVLESPESDITLLKRVVALPGEKVAVRGGRLYINDREMPIEGDGDDLTEALDGVRHRVRLTQLGGPDFGPVTLRDDHFLVMGDNRGESRDGRTFGTVHRDKIFGRAFAVYWRDGGFAWEDL